MSFEELQRVVLSQAQQEADSISATYQQQLQREEERITQRASELEEQIVDAGKKQGEQEAKRLHQEHQLSAKANVLTAKQEELEAAQAATVAHILAWDAEQTHQLLASLLAQLPNEAGTILPSSQHRDLLADLVDTSRYTMSDTTASEDGGFIFQGERTEMNMTVSQLVANLFRQHRSALAKRLFG